MVDVGGFFSKYSFILCGYIAIAFTLALGADASLIGASCLYKIIYKMKIRFFGLKSLMEKLFKHCLCNLLKKFQKKFFKNIGEMACRLLYRMATSTGDQQPVRILKALDDC